MEFQNLSRWWMTDNPVSWPMFKYTGISAASWIPTVSEDDGHKVPLAKIALSLQTQLTRPEEYAVMVNGNQPDLSM